MIKLGTKRDSAKIPIGEIDACVIYDALKNPPPHHIDEDITPHELVKIISDLSKLKQEGKLNDKQLTTVLKVIIAFFVERKIMSKIDCALENTIYKHCLS